MSRALLIIVFALLLGCKESAPAPPDLAGLLRGGPALGFAPIRAPVALEFPRDHGAHFAQRLEWWYFTGNLRAANGLEFGYQLTVFRLGLKPRAPSAHALAGEQLLMGHFALSDLSQQRYHSFERFTRLDQRLGVVRNPPLELRIDDWSIVEIAGPSLGFTLQANQDDIAIDLTLLAQSAVVQQGVAGFSQKSADPNNASAYYSVPRMTTRGTLKVGTQSVEVAGLSWFDREWSSSALADKQVGWRWYALHLDNGANLMLYALERADGEVDSYSRLSYVDASGVRTDLGPEDFEILSTRRWQAPTGIAYAVDSRVRVPKLRVDIEVKAALDAQHFQGLFSYWEGAVRVSGSHSGKGYLEMTGALAK